MDGAVKKHSLIFRDSFLLWHGRIGRKELIIKFVSIFICFISLILLLDFLLPKTVYLIFILPIVGVMHYMVLVLYIKRFHDLNMPEKWLLFILIPYLYEKGSPKGDFDKPMTGNDWVLVVLFLITLPFLYMLIFKKGTKGLNRFGDDPLQKRGV